jgi:hypothetical protein
MAVAKITKREADRLQPGQWVWDSEVKGFGIRRQTTEAVFYLLRYRANGKQSFLSIGRHGSPWRVGPPQEETHHGDLRQVPHPLFVVSLPLTYALTKETARPVRRL